MVCVGLCGRLLLFSELNVGYKWRLEGEVNISSIFYKCLDLARARRPIVDPFESELVVVKNPPDYRKVLEVGDLGPGLFKKVRLYI